MSKTREWEKVPITARDLSAVADEHADLVAYCCEDGTIDLSDEDLETLKNLESSARRGANTILALESDAKRLAALVEGLRGLRDSLRPVDKSAPWWFVEDNCADRLDAILREHGFGATEDQPKGGT